MTIKISSPKYHLKLSFKLHVYHIVGGVCNFLTSVSPQQKFEATDRPVLQLSYSSVLFGKQRKIHPQGMRTGQPKRRAGLNFGFSFHLFFSSPTEPALCKLGQPGGLFVSPEVLTPVLGPSFALISQDFSFLCLLATTILDSFFLF